MISTRVRIAAGITALVVAVAACYVLVHARRPIAAALFAPAALMALPLFASTRPPRADEYTSLNENVARFRTAGLICFSFAILINALGTSGRVAALGVAWWAVGFGLI